MDKEEIKILKDIKNLLTLLLIRQEGIQQKEIADLLGVDKSTISKLLSSKNSKDKSS